ncbi:MAG TPA: copper oxidase [Terriglobales bacterium]|nr:copper oxidase [Terriglobales bacterium]
MMKNRRDFLASVFGAGAGLAALPKLANSEDRARPGPRVHHANQSIAPISVVTPDVADLPWRLVDGAKEFHLIAEPVKQEILPGKVIDLWGYNGSAPGPTIQVNQGDRVRIIVENHLPEATAMHWHGFEISNEMDGAPGVSQEPIPPGGRFVYEFTLHQAGTFFYHSHMAMQEMMGMLGAFIMHPKQAYEPRVDQDFTLILQEYALLPNNSIPNSMNMEFNWLTLNGKSGPATTPLCVRLNDRVRLRFINLGMDHHPVHLHGHTFVITGTEGGRQPQTTWGPKNTVLVGVAEAYDVEFVANNPGDWMVHCHLPHHMMNQMSSMVGPMTRGAGGMPAGLDMERGMGMLRSGNAISPENGPSMGRGMGVGSTDEEATSNGPMQEMPGMNHGEHGAMRMGASEVSKDASRVPGFPQDAFMESPMMAMDKMVEKPETYGLRAGWSGYMQGMMTFLRVLPPETYDKIAALREQDKSHMQRMEHPNHE